MIKNIFEGSEFLLYDIDNNPIALSKNCALKIKQSLIDVTTKDSDNWKENLTSVKDWSIEFEGLLSYDNDKFNTSYFFSQFQKSEPFFIKFGVIQNNFNHTFWGEVALESIDIDTNFDDIVTYSGALKGIGQLEFSNAGTPAQSGYIKTESDPIFRGSPAFNITSQNKSEWFEAYNKTLTEVGFSTIGDKTILNVKLRDGSLYSTFFNQVGGSSGSVDLSNYYNKIQSDSRFQPIGNYVGQQFLFDYHYNKVDSDNRFYLKSNPDGFVTSTFVETKIADLVGQAPSTLDTLNELAIALGNDPNFATTISNQIGQKANISDVYSKITSDSIYKSINYVPSWSEVSNKPTHLSQFTNDLGNYGNWINAQQGYTLFQPLENQRLSSNNDVVFNKIKAVTELVIPASASDQNHSIWIGNANSSSNVPPTVTTLASLQDVFFNNLQNGQSISYDSTTGKWKNTSYQAAGNYAFTNGSNANGTWGINILGNAASASSVAWSNISGKQTNLSQYVNDLGNYGGFLLSDGAIYAGFGSNNINAPYISHASSGNVAVYLARADGINASGNWNINISGTSDRTQRISNQSSYMTFNWNGYGGQPQWLWGGNDSENMYVYNPANFNVAAAVSWNGQNYSSVELATPATWILAYDAAVGVWKPTGKNVINSYLGLGSAAFMDGNSWLKPSNHPTNVANYNFAIGTTGSYNFIQSHSGLQLEINPLGNKVVLNNATVLNDLIIPATPSGANQSIWIGNANSNGSNNPTITTLASLQDVLFSNLQNGQSISYDSTTGKWKNTNYQQAGNYALANGSNANGSWAINIIGNAGSANYINSPDGSRNPNDILPNANPNRVRFDFIQSNFISSGGNYGGVMTFSPWTGTVASTGDASYQLAFGSASLNATGVPQLRIRNGIDASWNNWYSVYTSANTTEIKSDLGLGSAAYGAYDWISVVGLASNNLNEPYLRRASDGAMAWLVNKDSLGSAAYLNATLVHRYNTFTADANTVPEHTSNFSYANNAPHNGYLGHFGAQGYGLQLSGQYGDGRKLSMRLRNGDAAAWNPWFQIYHSGDTNQVKSDLGLGTFAYRNYLTGNEVVTDVAVRDQDLAVSQMLRWKNYGNNHVIFDASNSTSPNGVAISNKDSQVPWSPAYPTLMGWNGNATYGVRVDTSRTADFWGGIAADYTTYATSIGSMLVADNSSIGKPATAPLIQQFLGLRSAAYVDESQDAIPHSIARRTDGGDIQVRLLRTEYPSDTGIPVNGSGHFLFQYQAGGGGTDNYARPASIGLVKSILGLGASAYTAETLDSVTARNDNVYREINIRDGKPLLYWNANNTLAARADMRSETLHQYVTRQSDGVPLQWRENWWDGTKYHNWTTDSLGFVANSKITAVSGGNGADTYAGALEVRGINAGITFHYPGNYAAPLWMGASGTLNWGTTLNIGGNITGGNDITAPQVYGTNAVVGGRVFAGYDSGVVGSVNASAWFRSNGATGWFNSTYGGGIWMTDTSWVRVYADKGFWVDNQVRAIEYQTMGGNYNVDNFGLGIVGLYNASRYQAVFSMGNAYRPAADGTSLNNSYGIVWTHENVGGQSKGGLGHQMLITEAGVTQTAIGNGIWTRANIYAQGQIEAPTLKATSKMVIPTSAPASPVSGCIWIS